MRLRDVDHVYVSKRMEKLKLSTGHILAKKPSGIELSQCGHFQQELKWIHGQYEVIQRLSGKYRI